MTDETGATGNVNEVLAQKEDDVIRISVPSVGDFTCKRLNAVQALQISARQSHILRELGFDLNNVMEDARLASFIMATLEEVVIKVENANPNIWRGVRGSDGDVCWLVHTTYMRAKNEYLESDATFITALKNSLRAPAVSN